MFSNMTQNPPAAIPCLENPDNQIKIHAIAIKSEELFADKLWERFYCAPFADVVRSTDQRSHICRKSTC